MSSIMDLIGPELSELSPLEPPAEWGDRNSSAVALQQGYDPPTVPACLPWAATRVA